jgi:GrpB-like predicted nucleotidyltransferase (UPF0157 family)
VQRRVEILPYRAEWPALFRAEADRLSGVLGEEMLAIHHIGSTAIPGISAKPIIDILVEVTDIAAVDRYSPALVEIGYTAHGEYGIPGRRFYTKGGDEARTHHLHIFQSGDPEIQRHLSFRDYMLAHPREARRYGLLKEELACKYPADINGYMDGKDAFIREIDHCAKIWRNGNSGVK